MHILVAVCMFAVESHYQSSQPNADNTAGVKSGETEGTEFPGYCGLYALHRGMAALGRQADFGDLIRPDYVSRGGSTVEQLLKAAEDMGVECRYLTHLNCSALRLVSSPTLLHVKAHLGSSTYDHWVLYLGVDGDKARICDGTREIQLVEFKDLSAGWDGAGIILNPPPNLYQPIALAVLTPYLWLCAAALMVMSALRWGWRRLSAPWISARDRVWLNWSLQAFAVAGAACLVAGASGVGGFLSSRSATVAVQDEKIGAFLPVVKVDNMERIASRAEMIIVDARRHRDFALGHIPNAVNIPPSATPEDCSAALRDVPKVTPIVIYCQSNGCPYSSRVARSLSSCGFHDLCLFPGGWLEWKEHQNRSDAR